MREPASAPRIMFSVAEISGDVYAADLARHLRRLQPSLGLFGAGGPHMAAAGVDVRLDISHTSTFGLWDLIASLPGHLRSGLAIRRMLVRARPDLLVLVDAPGFNFPLARIARRLAIPTIYYVPPQTWLWNPDAAARRLRRAVDSVVAIFESEAALYRGVGAPVAYFGHPLADLAAAPRESRGDVRRRLGVLQDTPTVGLFPGSRQSEVARLLPAMMQAIDLVEGCIGRPQVLVGVASARLRPFIERTLGGRDRFHLIDHSRDVLQASDVSIAASGTVLLEAVALDAPVIMTYRLDRLTHYYAKYVLQVRRVVPFYSIPNIVLGEAVIPELVEERATPALMAKAVITYLTDADARSRMLDGYMRIRARLGAPRVVERLAAHVVQILDHTTASDTLRRR